MFLTSSTFKSSDLGLGLVELEDLLLGQLRSLYLGRLILGLGLVQFKLVGLLGHLGGHNLVLVLGVRQARPAPSGRVVEELVLLGH